ncbi:hypothetical protein SLEP1_g27256 [Rubroshorea leprosula]|uniref:Uncharacterized protein n=1 Tax=Rubroshorea leprosula TaxID=152421 RepID=A0AAV5JZ43_9ROSI|nr:hypothetical protein SLEP1_g27256 [Rubroshorea leprosula]
MKFTKLQLKKQQGLCCCNLMPIQASNQCCHSKSMCASLVHLSSLQTHYPRPLRWHAGHHVVKYAIGHI